MLYKKVTGWDYPQFFDYYANALASVWRPEEVALKPDLLDWQHNISEAEREVIGGVLRGFTTMEIGISDYWSDVVCKIFPKPEIVSMARIFAAFEWIHAQAYNYLSDTLGINEFDAFLSDPSAQKKVEHFFAGCASEKVSLAVFSGAGEGVSLYSSFAILLAFSKDGRFKGLAQIISWSSIDEEAHSNAGSELFRELVKETGITDQEIEQIYEGFRAVVDNEFSFLDNAFANAKEGALPVSLPEQKAYIKSRANDRLINLELVPIFPMTPEEEALAQSVSDWFDPMISGQMSTDFFARQKAGDSYVSKPSQDYSTVNLGALCLEVA